MAEVGNADRLLGGEGLEIGAVHEIKPMPGGSGWTAGWTAARAFALALAGRRLLADDADPIRRDRMLLWCVGAGMGGEFGLPYGAGLTALGIDPGRLIVAEPASAQDALWVLEEALGSGALALVAGEVDEIGLTPARRLALAAARTHTPCLVVTHPRAEATAATATRWRVGPALSPPHPFDACAPGAVRFAVALERCRSRPLPGSVFSILEWCDAAYHFRVACDVADRADASGQSGSRAGSASGPPRAAVRAG
ncbi:MAG: hypothetical protein AB7O43_07380 [Hyphomicrobiaceae bacterium]